MAARNDTPLTDAQRDLAGSPEALRAAGYWAARYGRRLPPFARDDLYAATLYGCVLAARTYRPGPRGFAGWVQMKVELEARQYLRLARARAARAGTPGGPDELAAALSPAPPVGRELEQAEEVGRLLRGLTPRQRGAVEACVLHGMNGREAGGALGCSRVAAEKLLAAGLARLVEQRRAA